MNRFACLLGAFALLLLPGCAEKEAPFAIVLHKIAGDNQQGTLNHRLMEDIKVQLTTPQGTPLKGALVCFAVTEGGGTVQGANGTACQLTDANGSAQVGWAIGPSGKAHTLRAAAYTSAGTQIPGTAQYFHSRLSTYLIAGGETTATGGTPLGTPTDVFGDAAGNIYVTDQENQRVLKFAPGSYTGVTVAGGNGAGPNANQFRYPDGIHADAAGNLYVADIDNHRIQKWAPGATSGVTVAGGNGPGNADNQLKEPLAVATDAAGNIYVADYGNNRIQRWAPGQAAGVTVGQVWLPASVAVDGAGNVYSAYSSDYPRRLLKWAPGATDPEVLLDGLTTSFTVSDLFAEADGTLYVADPANKRIFKLEPGSGTPVKVAGGSWGGNDLNNIQHAGSIYVDAAGAMFVLDSGNDRIVKWLP